MVNWNNDIHVTYFVRRPCQWSTTLSKNIEVSMYIITTIRIKWNRIKKTKKQKKTKTKTKTNKTKNTQKQTNKLHIYEFSEKVN